MKVCLLTDQDLEQDPFPEDDWPCDPRPFLDADWTLAVLDKKSAVPTVTELAGRGFDLFFNLCDGAWDEPRPGIEVVRTLERLGQAFTGADSTFFEPSREAMKRVCHAWDVATPGYAMIRKAADVERALDTLAFPMIVKHPSSYASAGLTPASRVESGDALREQIRRTREAYGEALVEEFIEGSEATVLVAENADDPAEPIVYTPLRYRFPEGESFKHEKLKWVDYEGLEALPVEDAALEEELRRMSARFFRGMRGTGYGRCDLRIDRDGRPWMLEINPLCGVYYPPGDDGSADLILRADPAGHGGFTRTIVEAALARARRQGEPWRVLPMPGGPATGYGLFATRDVAAGERLIAFEEREHRLVTLSHVEAAWDERRRDWFDRYAWPLTDEVWVTWDDDPEGWMPVNHSCDPSAWLDGLDVVARGPLESGDEITLDYGTFMSDRMPAFACGCGADRCRGTVRGTDWRLPEMARYGGHVSDWVRRRRGM